LGELYLASETIDTVAHQYGLAFIPYQEQRYDFIVPKARLGRPAVQAFERCFDDAAVRERLRAARFSASRS
jgi:putative molybdopterin biosynthesis protein